jgi:hypothetical protein
VSRWLAIAAICAAVCAGCGRFGFGTEIDGGHLGSGGGSDGGSATGSDAGSGDQPSCTGFDLCDQFEDPSLSPVWQVFGDVTHSTLAHRGTGSLHFGMPAITAGKMGGSLIAETQTFAGGAAPFWVRVWVRFGAHADVKNNLELLSADQSTMGGLADYLFAEANSTDLYSQFDNRTQPLPVAIPLNTWTCLIWYVAPDAGNMHLDGDLGSSSYSGVANGSPPVSVIVIGPNLSSTNVVVDQPAFEVWLDDVIVNHAAVTCAD